MSPTVLNQIDTFGPVLELNMSNTRLMHRAIRDAKIEGDKLN